MEIRAIGVPLERVEIRDDLRSVRRAWRSARSASR